MTSQTEGNRTSQTQDCTTPRVISINISTAKGTIKTPIDEATLSLSGIDGDAHAGDWHRQVSLLAQERIDHFAREAGQSFAFGAFAENITTTGIDWTALRIGDRFQIGAAELELTQFGKECHGDGCAVHRAVGRCVMPTQGVFARVLRGGVIRTGDPITLLARPLTAVVLTLSDRASQGHYPDRSGPAVEARLTSFCAEHNRSLICQRQILPDDPAALAEALQKALAARVDVLITTGGTGLGPRDITPETVTPLLTKAWPGIMDYIRQLHAPRLPGALLSRAVAGVAGKTVVFTLPGSERAVHEYLDVILNVLAHTLKMVAGSDDHGPAPAADRTLREKNSQAAAADEKELHSDRFAATRSNT